MPNLAKFAAPAPASANAYGIASGAGYGGRGLDSSIQLRAAEDKVEKQDLSRRYARSQLDSGIESEALFDGLSAAGRLSDRGRSRRRLLYEKLEKTQEWAENNYWHLPIEQQNGQLVSVNGFWNDYAKHAKDRPFFSNNWPTATGNFTEMMFALGLLDLPFESEEHTTEFKDGRMTFTAASPTIIFNEQIRETEEADEESRMLITQNFFRADDRYRMVSGVRQDKFVTDEFLTHVVYGCQVVLTNPTSTPRRVQLLAQIPYAALPTNGSKSTSTVDLDLGPFQTQTHEFFFYFPVRRRVRTLPSTRFTGRNATRLREVRHVQSRRQTDEGRHAIVGLHLAVRRQR